MNRRPETMASCALRVKGFLSSDGSLDEPWARDGASQAHRPARFRELMRQWKAGWWETLEIRAAGAQRYQKIGRVRAQR